MIADIYKQKSRPPFMFNDKKGFSPILVIILIGAILISAGVISVSQFAPSNWGLGAFTDLTKVYKLNWGHIECVQNADYNINYVRYADDVQLYKCDDYTNECLIQAQLDREPSIFLSPLLKYQICDLSGTSCSIAQTTSLVRQSDVFSYTLPKGKSFKVVTGSYGSTKTNIMKISKKVKTFYIRGVENGNIFVQESCILSSALRGKVTADGLNELTFSGTNSRQNYVTDFIEVATKTYKYNSQDVICQARILYGVTSQPMKDGSVVKVQGATIKGVDCCPAEANCDATTFKFVANNVRECTYSSECSNGGMPIAVTSTSFYTFSCSSQGTCLKGATQTAECTNDQACVLKWGQGSVCDMSRANYGKCIQETKPNYCGNGKCESLDGEDGTTCPADCSNCPIGQIWIPEESKCKPVPSSNWPIWVWVLIVFVSFLLLVKFVPAFRSLCKRTPVLNWVTP